MFAEGFGGDEARRDGRAEYPRAEGGGGGNEHDPPCIHWRVRSGWRGLGREVSARPGGNSTGFTNVEFAMAGKWVELLKDITPGLKRVTNISTHKPPQEAEPIPPVWSSGPPTPSE